MWIIVELPKPLRTIIVNANAGIANEFAGISMAGLENAVEGNAVIGIQLVPPQNVSVLLPGVQPHVKAFTDAGLHLRLSFR